MNSLFDTVRVGSLELQNRFVRSATFEARGDGDGGVTPEVLAFYETLGRGGLGAIVSGIMYVRQDGKGAPAALGIHRDEMIPGLRRLADVMKVEDTRAIFQLHHAGGQTMKRVTGSRPRGPSGNRRDPMMMEKPRPLEVAEIGRLVRDFADAAARAQEAGADGVQVHAAHGYLLSEFLSPFFNHRTDEYGGDPDSRYRLVGEVIQAVRARVGPGFPVLVKMNIDDGTPGPGMTPGLAAHYASRLAADGIGGLEISAGSTTWAPFVMCRGEAHTREFAAAAPWPVRPLADRRLKATRQPPLEEAYNAPGLAPVKAALGDVPLALVGGMRTFAAMEECVEAGTADLISMSRPLIREPGLVAKLRVDPSAGSSCISCNRCLAAIYRGLPVRCYVRGLPGRRTAG